MNQLYPIIRRKRRPLIEVETPPTQTAVSAPKPAQPQVVPGTTGTQETQTTAEKQKPNEANATNGTDVVKDETKADAPETQQPTQ